MELISTCRLGKTTHWSRWMPKGGLHPVESPHRSRLLAGLVASWGTHNEAVCEELRSMGRTHVGEVCGDLSSVGGTTCWSRGRVGGVFPLRRE